MTLVCDPEGGFGCLGVTHLIPWNASTCELVYKRDLSISTSAVAPIQGEPMTQTGFPRSKDLCANIILRAPRRKRGGQAGQRLGRSQAGVQIQAKPTGCSELAQWQAKELHSRTAEVPPAQGLVCHQVFLSYSLRGTGIPSPIIFL